MSLLIYHTTEQKKLDSRNNAGWGTNFAPTLMKFFSKTGRHSQLKFCRGTAVLVDNMYNKNQLNRIVAGSTRAENVRLVMWSLARNFLFLK